MGLKRWAIVAGVALGLRSAAAAFIKGHDLSSVGYMETDKGVSWYDEAGVNKPVEKILGDGGMQSVRLRLWTADEYGLNYTLGLAKRFYAAGFSIFLNLHLSDSWADPGKQGIPAAWNASSVESLSVDLRQYIKSTLMAFSAAGVRLKIVSLGNEVRSGMLFPLGSITDNDFTNFAKLWSAARAGVEDAVAAGVKRPEVMLQLDNGWYYEALDWFYSSLFATGIVKSSDVDTIGVSFYPFYGLEATIEALNSSLTRVATKYKKPIYVAETNYPSECTTGVELSVKYPASPEGQIQWIKAIISVLRGLPRNLGVGIFNWEPAFMSSAGLDSACESLLLFTADWSGWPKSKANALPSVNLFK